ncbi:hypothetical protein EJB05_29096, partial [Eragrostis curvula]
MKRRQAKRQKTITSKAICKQRSRSKNKGKPNKLQKRRESWKRRKKRSKTRHTKQDAKLSFSTNLQKRNNSKRNRLRRNFDNSISPSQSIKLIEVIHKILGKCISAFVTTTRQILHYASRKPIPQGFHEDKKIVKIEKEDGDTSCIYTPRKNILDAYKNISLSLI